jgi:hypothetical protein
MEGRDGTHASCRRETLLDLYGQRRFCAGSDDRGVGSADGRCPWKTRNYPRREIDWRRAGGGARVLSTARHSSRATTRRG